MRQNNRQSSVQIIACRLFIASLTTGNKFTSSFNRNMKTFFEGNSFANAFCKMAAILFRPQYVNIYECTTIS